jgi:hypothetical protein
VSRIRQQSHLLRQTLHGTPGLEVTDPPPGQRWNGYSFLATVTLPGARAFCEHLAAACGVPNSVGTFRLVPADQRPELAAYAGPPCRNAATVLDRTLAVLLTDHDDDQRITQYAQTIVREAHRWRQHT